MQIKEEQLLYEWLEKAMDISDGRRLEANIRGEHEHSGQKQLHSKACRKLSSIHVIAPIMGVL